MNRESYQDFSDEVARELSFWLLRPFVEAIKADIVVNLHKETDLRKIKLISKTMKARGVYKTHVGINIDAAADLLLELEQTRALTLELLDFNLDVNLTKEKYPIIDILSGVRRIKDEFRGNIFSILMNTHLKILEKRAKYHFPRNHINMLIMFLNEVKEVNPILFDYLGLNTIARDNFKQLQQRLNEKTDEVIEKYGLNAAGAK